MPQFNNYPAPILPMTGAERFVAGQANSTVSPTLFQMLAGFNVADLPTAAVTRPAVAYALDGRNSGEGPGAGTGCLVTLNSASVWAAVWSGVAVEA